MKDKERESSLTLEILEKLGVLVEWYAEVRAIQPCLRCKEIGWDKLCDNLLIMHKIGGDKISTLYVLDCLLETKIGFAMNEWLNAVALSF